AVGSPTARSNAARDRHCDGAQDAGARRSIERARVALRTRHRPSRFSKKGFVMHDLYFWTTPNGYKILLFAEEAGIPYTIKPFNISKGEQFAPEFLKISPNNRMPALVDHEPKSGTAPISVFESGAILLYLAEK